MRWLAPASPTVGSRILPVRPGLAWPGRQPQPRRRRGARPAGPAPPRRLEQGMVPSGATVDPEALLPCAQTTAHPRKARTQPRRPCMLGPRAIRSRLRGAKLVRSRTYEITFVGQAGTVLQAEFDDCAISVGPSTTTLRLERADQGALHGLLQRIASFSLELIDVSVVPPADVRQETSKIRQLNSGQGD
jgi:hypothetical protein